MTVEQFLAQSLGNTRYPDISAMPVESRAEVIAILNAAVQQYFQLAPDVYKRTTGTHAIAAPRELAGVSIAVNSTTSTGTQFDPADRGKTILTAAGYNEIVDATTVLRPNTSAAAVTAATVYDDTVAFFDSSVDRVVNHLRCITGNSAHTLARVDAERAQQLFSWAHVSQFARIMGAWTFRERSTAPYPLTYGVLNVGQSVASGTVDAAFLIRVDPLPTSACALEIQFDQLPAAYSIAAILDGTVLPVPDQRIHSMLRPLFVNRLLGSGIWTGGELAVQSAREDYMSAREAIASLPGTFAVPSAWIGTQRGY